MSNSKPNNQKDISSVGQYAVFGNPIAHSKSPDIHHAFAEQTGQSIQYVKKLSEIEAFESDVSAFFQQGGLGCNVTVPFKERAFNLAEILTDRARIAGAVNTLYINEVAQIIGDNTDGEGLVQDLIRNGAELQHARILVLGAGGAARGVVLPLLERQPAQIVIANRTLSKAEQIVTEINRQEVSAQALDEIDCGFDVVINSTSASLSGTLPDVSPVIFDGCVLAYDMMYAANATAFNQWAKTHRVKNIVDGLGMLVGQAAESFSIWRGIKPDVEPVLTKLRQELRAQ